MHQGSEHTNLRVFLRHACLGLLLTHLCSGGSADETTVGCKDWNLTGEKDIVCIACHPGNRLVSKIGGDPKVLCTPCDKGHYILKPAELICPQCTQCIGVQYTVTECTISSDTVCGCKPGYRCGDEGCSFCAEECGKGKEPNGERSCRDCPEGTFNDQIHQKCKPWSKSCVYPKEHIVSEGNATNDIECSRSSESKFTPPVTTSKSHSRPADSSEEPAIALIAVIAILVTVIIALGIAVFGKRIHKKMKHSERKYTVQVIATPTTDEPRTLRSEPGEYSYHPPQQEHGRSTESLTESQTSKDPLLV